jgi:hypothetical protein
LHGNYLLHFSASLLLDAWFLPLPSEERATRVRLMGDIYGRAMSSAIWLGPEVDESGRVVKLLEQALGASRGQVRHAFVMTRRI